MTVYNTLGMGTYNATWQYNGYSGAGNVKDIINSNENRPAVVVGGARGVFEELDIVKTMYGPDDLVTLAVNDVGMYIERVDHWVSLHGGNFPMWKSVRWLYPISPSPTMFHSHGHTDLDYNWQGLSPLFALSGYFAMQIAYLLGCSPIILVGCPGDGTPRFFESKRKDGFSYGGGLSPSDKGIRSQIVGEMNRLPDFKSRVRSTSGWTQFYFGGI